MRNRVAPVVCWIAILGLLVAGVTKLGDARHASGDLAAAPQKTIEYVEWEKPAPPAWLQWVTDDEELDAVRANLETLVKVQCEKRPLDQALKLLEAQVGIKILMNTVELGLMGVDPEAPVTVEASGKLKDVLRLTLAAVENADAGLAWRLSPSGILITSRDDADAEPQLRIFDLTYFLPDASHADELMTLIMMHVEPDTWLVAGGPNVISHFGSQLVVTAPNTTMVRIEELLAKISKQDREHLKAPKFKEDMHEPKVEPEAGLMKR